MQLTLFSDYSLRLLLYLAAHRDRTVSVQEVSRAYGVSPHHMVKIVQRLVEQGLVATVRGRNGGLRLAAEPSDINIGALVRATEPSMNLVECFDRDTNTCPIARACGLKGVLREAQAAFLGVLDSHTLADFQPQTAALLHLWKAGPAGTELVHRPARRE
jgi:Rrf2 family transcriptional regulator, nitric oxide-sensitive transcriptional repressor